MDSTNKQIPLISNTCINVITFTSQNHITMHICFAHFWVFTVAVLLRIESSCSANNTITCRLEVLECAKKLRTRKQLGVKT